MTGTKLAASLAGVVLVVACANAQPGPTHTADSAVGKILTDSNGMTLYTFDRDTPEKSNCNGQCAQNWPPLAASANAQAQGAWSVVTRDDGSKMWAYNNKPVYRWNKDQKPGDTTGDGVNNVWHVARP
jgi:predicted lipoprotein with Yx(FWY)xxD motif